ncbi:hypothetical protein [Phytoactinopolyspora halotolerans]|uniref:Uncharacterized protein n=1 Tax=Phytoactinopolyspora halotolerans TaxID=1981512 RepID=A0A6L9S9I3_9ACTN|nr:hypothetical protein [Phytoactinopolyspora halotolerans]NEE01361.1 hypothetical protein [Phytoactinopolyspora halotolerans]
MPVAVVRITPDVCRRRDPGTGQHMAEDRRTKETPTPGEDPREIDRERTTERALKEQEAQDGLVHGQRPVSGMGISSDAPGRDLDDLDEAPDVPKYRDKS